MTVILAPEAAVYLPLSRMQQDDILGRLPQRWHLTMAWPICYPLIPISGHFKNIVSESPDKSVA